jgi:hypothetical protein
MRTNSARSELTSGLSRAQFAVDPDAPAQRGITDLDKAPTDGEGLVHFTGDFSILKPVDPARGNRRLFFDWREMDSNLYGAFPVKQLFWFVAGSLFGAGKGCSSSRRLRSGSRSARKGSRDRNASKA